MSELTNLIWTSVVDPTEWDYAYYVDECEANGTEPKEDAFEDWCYETNNMYLDDEKCNLDIDVNGIIIAVGYMGLWNGKRPAIFKCSENIADSIFNLHNNFRSIEDVEYIGKDNDIIAKLFHHDGTNVFTFRRVKDEETADMLIEAMADCVMDEAKLIECTESIYNDVANIYGWSCVE